MAVTVANAPAPAAATTATTTATALSTTHSPAAHAHAHGGYTAAGAAGAASSASSSEEDNKEEQQQPVEEGESVAALPPTHKFEPSNFTLLRTLGTGTFARVCLVRPAAATTALDQDPTAEVYALKILRKADVVQLKQVEHVRHERAVLADVAGHPFITTLRASFSDADSLYMLLDYVPGGELFSYLRRLRRFDEAVARFYAAEIVLVLEFLHEHQGGVAYRDLKPENLLLDRDGHIKLVDFGFAKRLGGAVRSPARRRARRHGPAAAAADDGADDENDGNAGAATAAETYTLCGTPEYLAPEVIHNKGHTTAVDWWALGILLYEFLTGYPPFWHQNPIEIYKQIVEKPVAFPHEPAVSAEAQDLIRSLCTIDRSRRLGNISGGAARVKAHPFFRPTDWDELLQRRRRGPILPPIRYPGDAQCFDTYPDEDPRRKEYTPEMAAQYDHYFRDF